MSEQPHGHLPAKVNPRGQDVETCSTAHELIPGRNSLLPKSAAMSDAERLVELRSKLCRLEGHKELSAKQEQAANAIVREIISIEGINGEELRAALGVAEPS
jgi:hypothetical protein